MILEKLRGEFSAAGIDGLFFYRTNSFLTEEITAGDERLKFLTGFSGSLGFLVVLREKAALFADPRYIEQAKFEVANPGIEVLEYPANTPLEWLINNSIEGTVVGIDPFLCPALMYGSFEKGLERSGRKVKAISNIIDAVWKDREYTVYKPVEVRELKYAGEGHESKIKVLQEKIVETGALHMLVTALDDIAWLFNLRGTDIPHTPLFYSYAIVGKGGVFLYAAHKVDLEGVTVKKMEEFLPDLEKIADEKVLVDPRKTVQGVAVHLRNPVVAESPINLLKSVKNDIEVRGAKMAHLKEGVVFASLFEWLSRTEKKALFELDIMAKIDKLREELPDYRGASFTTIAAADGHAGMPHYNANERTNKRLDGKVLLIDSGAQYLDGTTDMTRTLSLDGEPSGAMKHDYTLVLKGHIALASATFPEDATGSQLDVLARQFLWREGKDYGHGTGHGVGSYLSVHETPPSFSSKVGRPGGNTELKPGMIISNEPGYYTETYGIRIENLLLVAKTEKGLVFENLTLVPYEQQMIDVSMLSKEEKNWVNEYHANVYNQLKSHISGEVKAWLKKACRKL